MVLALGGQGSDRMSRLISISLQGTANFSLLAAPCPVVCVTEGSLRAGGGFQRSCVGYQFV